MENKHLLFERIFAEYRDKLYRLCYSYTKDESLSEDLVQECFSRIWIYLPGFAGRSDIGTWIYRIAANTCLMQLRKSGKKEVEYQESMKHTAMEESGADQEERSAALFDAIKQLKEMDRLIVSMVLEDMPQKQIGEVLGITENNVNIKVHRIKKRLKEIMEKKH